MAEGWELADVGAIVRDVIELYEPVAEDAGFRIAHCGYRGRRNAHQSTSSSGRPLPISLTTPSNMRAVG